MIIEKTVTTDAQGRVTRVLEDHLSPLEEWAFRMATKVRAAIEHPTFQAGSCIAVHLKPNRELDDHELNALADAILAQLPVDPRRAGQSFRFRVTTAWPPPVADPRLARVNAELAGLPAPGAR